MRPRILLAGLVLTGVLQCGQTALATGSLELYATPVGSGALRTEATAKIGLSGDVLLVVGTDMLLSDQPASSLRLAAGYELPGDTLEATAGIEVVPGELVKSLVGTLQAQTHITKSLLLGFRYNLGFGDIVVNPYLGADLPGGWVIKAGCLAPWGTGKVRVYPSLGVTASW